MVFLAFFCWRKNVTAVLPVPRRPTKKHLGLLTSSAALIAGVSTKSAEFCRMRSYSANECPILAFFTASFGSCSGAKTFSFDTHDPQQLGWCIVASYVRLNDGNVIGNRWVTVAHINARPGTSIFRDGFTSGFAETAETPVSPSAPSRVSAHPPKQPSRPTSAHPEP